MAFPITAQKYGTLPLISLWVIDRRPGAAGRLHFTTRDTPRPLLKNYLHLTNYSPSTRSDVRAIRHFFGRKMICRPTAEAESWGLSARSCTASSARRCEGAREEPTSNDLMWGTGPRQDHLLRHVPTGLHLCSWRGRAGNVLAHEPITGYWTENKCINNEEVFGACRVLLRSGLSKDHPHQNTHVLEELPNKHPLKL